jgi:VWD domain-containing protein/NleD-like pathogen effector protein (putative zinc metallopeptidase)
MRYGVRLVGVAVLVGGALLAAPGTAGAAPAAGLSVTVRAGDPLAPSLLLTNRGTAPCQVAGTSIGTVAVTRVTQGGTAVTATAFDPGLDDAADVYLAQRLRTLAPGGSATVPLRVVPFGPTGHALEVITWSGYGSLGALYPVKPGRPLTLDLTYAVPVTPAAGPPVCVVAATGPASAVPAGVDWVLWGLLGALVLLVLVGLVLLLVLLRRRRPPAGRAAVLALLLVAGLAGQAWYPRPARADIGVDSSLSGAYGDCLKIFQSPGGDPGGLLPILNGPGVHVQIQPAGGDQTHESAFGKDNIFIFWDPNDRHKYAGTGGNADPCTSLYHEMYHAGEDARGGQDHSPCVTADGPSGLPVNEVNATRVQNQLRQKLGLPQRSHYGDTPLPKGDCLPPDKQPKKTNCTGAGCGDTNGDPHIRTFDGRRYDFMAAGEFVAAKGDGLQIQVRQQPYPGSRLVSVNTAVAMDVAGDRVEVGLSGRALTLRTNGGPAGTPASGSLPHGGSVTVALGYLAPVLTVAWPDGSSAAVSAIGSWGLHLTVAPAPARARHLSGLLGDFDGDATNDLSGTPSPAFADRWRVTAATSLFTYEPGTGPDTYVDRNFPDRSPQPADLADRTGAQALCARFGITDPQTLADCVLDVALTGRPEFAAEATTTQAIVQDVAPSTSTGTFSGTEATLTVSKPGEAVRYTFAGTAGQRLYIQVLSTTMADGCGLLTLRDPAGATLGGGCIIGGKGQVDGTVLPTTGTYTIELRAPDNGTGQARLRLVFSTDVQATATLNGPPVQLAIGAPGQVANVTFTGAAGQRVFVDATASTLPEQCGLLNLRGLDHATLSGGCVIGGKGFVDGTVLPADGTYTLVVDPAETGTGQITLRLSASVDQHGTIDLNGAAVTGTVTTPGQVVDWSFSGSAGQKVILEISGNTLPDQCASVVVRGPDRSLIGGTCVLGATATSNPITLPGSGRYTVVLDPADHGTGQATIRLRSA